MKKYCIILSATFLILSAGYSQTISKTKIKGTYVSLRAATFFSYEFKLDNTYQYKIFGHFGNSLTIGQYRISQDTIILTAFPKAQQRDTAFYFEADTLIIDSDHCLINFPMGYEHLRIENKNDTIYTSKKRNLNLPGRPK